jgi:hypothetical protein
VALGAFDLCVEGVLKGDWLFGMNIVASLGAKGDTVGILPRLDAHNGEDGEGEGKAAAEKHGEP